MKVSARLPTSGRNGGTTVAPSAWYQTGWPLGSVTGCGIAEPAHSAHHAEVVIERPVLLHQHHDVLDVPERAGRPIRRDRQRPSDAVGQHRRRDAAARELEEPAPTDVPHQHHLPHIHGQRPCAALL